MNSIMRLSFQNLTKVKLQSYQRFFSTTSSLTLKQIQETTNNNEITIEGVYVNSPHSNYMIKLDGKSDQHQCSLCALGLDVKHTDVLILSQFVCSDGCMLPKRITGLCYKQQKKVSTLVTMAQKAGLMPNLTPSNSKKDPTKRYGYKKFNKYFDESTIKIKV